MPQHTQATTEQLNRRIRRIKRPIFEMFEDSISDHGLDQIADLKSNRTNYLVAATPRSGSSFFCDLLEQAGTLGRPNEYLNPTLVPSIRQSIPGTNIVDYWAALVNRRTKASVFGFKASYFQYVPMIESGLDKILFEGCKLVFLFRKNLLLQAISLYLATETDIYHTNIEHSGEKWEKLKAVDYDEVKIRQWLEHIHAQEKGWTVYGIGTNTLVIYYEELILNPNEYVRKVADHLGVKDVKNVDINTLSFKKISSDMNLEFAERFLSEDRNYQYLKEVQLAEERFC